VQDNARRWLETAVGDIQAARAMRESGFHSHACFIAQQSAEKSLKAIWFACDLDPWGHSIQRLVEQFPRREWLKNYDRWLETASILDKFYIPTRYPNGLPDDRTPSQSYIASEAEHGIACAQLLLDCCREILERLSQTS
jgi:HEPN domain-containing protein